MAYNFKSIADVEVVAEPTKSANVLIEEDGVIKKAPKTAVGGAGGGLSIVYDNNNDYKILYAPDGLYELIQEMLTSYQICDISLYSYSNYDGQVEIHKYNMKSIRVYSESIFIDCGTYCASVYPDGNIKCYYYD